MGDKKRVIILVIIALVLAATAIVLNIMGSDEVPTTRASNTAEDGASQVGVEIQPGQVEDKLAEAGQETQS